MTDTLETLQHKIASAGEVASVVSAMKAVAASSIGQYENAVTALTGYKRTVQLALSLCYKQTTLSDGESTQLGKSDQVGVIVFGSDQGLVGQFNDQLAEFVTGTVNKLSGDKKIWAIGERMRSSLLDAGLVVDGGFALPSSVAAISFLITDVLNTIEPLLPDLLRGGLYLIHNTPQAGAVYGQTSQKLLPLDAKWQSESASLTWPTKNLPEIIGKLEPALIREYLFISIYQACAESLASENASRLAAMQRAEKNVSDLQTALNQTYQRLRQSSIDEELFDVISGFNALTKV